MRFWPALPLAIVLAAGCGAEEERRPERASAAPAPDFTFRLPDGWHQFPESQTPALTNPVEILSAGTVAPGEPGEGSCAHVPVSALERMGPRDAFVTVQERLGAPHFPPRPEPFTLPKPSEGTDFEVCARNGEQLDIHWFGFRDAHRGFHVLVAFGRDAPAERRAEATSLLESMRFEPAPEEAFFDDEAGLTWEMPDPPWRRFDGPLTSLVGERLLLGTFDLPRAPPDGNCTPRAAIDALPADGAFIYVFEYLDRVYARLPQFPERPTLGPERRYECMGDSRMAAWQDHGRAFQAHVYIGPRAGEQLERDARSILSSIQAR